MVAGFDGTLCAISRGVGSQGSGSLRAELADPARLRLSQPRSQSIGTGSCVFLSLWSTLVLSFHCGCRFCFLVMAAVVDGSLCQVHALLICKAAAEFVLNLLTLPDCAYLYPDSHPDGTGSGDATVQLAAGWHWLRVWHRPVVPHRLAPPLRWWHRRDIPALRFLPGRPCRSRIRCLVLLQLVQTRRGERFAELAAGGRVVRFDRMLLCRLCSLSLLLCPALAARFRRLPRCRLCCVGSQLLFLRSANMLDIGAKACEERTPLVKSQTPRLHCAVELDATLNTNEEGMSEGSVVG